MVSSARPALVCLLLILTANICAQSQTVPEKTATASVSGKVTLKGKGVSGVVVGLILNDNNRSRDTRSTATTGEDGVYRLTNVEPGNYEVSAAAPAYVATRRTLIIGKADEIENVDFALVRGGVITGKVTDPEGRPVIETEVTVFLMEFEPGNQTRAGIRTDDRGIYRAFGLRAGKYRVSAGRDETAAIGDLVAKSEFRLTFHPAATEASRATIIEVAEGGEVTNVDITLGRTSLIFSASGRLVDGETGKPVAGVTYGVQKFIDKRFSGSRIGGVSTNKNGEFKLQNLAPGEYMFIAQPPPESDWKIDPVSFEIVDQDLTGLEARTSKGGSISGVILLDGPESRTVQDLRRLEVAGSFRLTGGPQISTHRARVAPDGSFTMRGLSRGTVHLFVFGPDRVQLARIERDGITQTNGFEMKDLEQITGVRIFVDYANGAIRGTVKLANGPVPEGAQFLVSWRRVGDGEYVMNTAGSVQVDARGQFVVENLLPGTYDVQATLLMSDKHQAGRGLSQIKQEIVVTSGNTSNVALAIPQQQ